MSLGSVSAMAASARGGLCLWSQDDYFKLLETDISVLVFSLKVLLFTLTGTA